MNPDEQRYREDPPGLFIRKMTLNDLDQVVAIDQVSFSLPWPPRSFQFELTDNAASRCWVAESGGRVVALIVGWLIVDELHIATIATHPEHRRRGIGKRLLLHALLAARREGAVKSFLEVRESNIIARKMYRDFGFVEDGRRKEYYKDNNEDAILMTLNDLGHLQGA
ncbi:MAG: ribosomal-protein-alanine N-acetyltransferase [Chloroflexi bacterium]|nr:ribosomal-protein-alanine N-acetyltransferase [Chloroflexota bacterium]MDL1942715.1 ribosomal-protein-alanine N-acetyltransferase [Chloroflexi bacterium CFX2]